MGLLELFVAATMPVLKVLLMTAVGSFLASNRVGILGEDGRKHLNNAVFYVFNPALVCTNLSQTITFESMGLLWFMPLNILIINVIGAALGWVVIRITNPPSHLRGLILGCCAAGNLGTLLLIIVPAICKENGSPFGDPEICRTYGLAYVSLSMAIGAIFLWTYVYNIVRISSLKSTTEDGQDGCTPSTRFPGETTKLLRGEAGVLASTNNYIIVEDCADQIGSQLQKLPVLVRIKQFLTKVLGKINLKKLLAPSTIAVIVGFVVGMTPQIRRALIGGDAPLRVIHDSALLMGDGAIPTLTLIMGGNLLKGIRRSETRHSYIIGIIVTRYIVLPLLGIVVVRGAYHLGLVHSDPLYQFVLMLQFAVPPAMNIGTITQLFGAGESECSVIFLWTYSLASISLTLWSTLFMWIVS